VYPYDIVPILTAPLVQDKQRLVSLVHQGDGLGHPAALITGINSVWRDDGSFELKWGTEAYRIPPLPDEP
jgi:hypothetical protein